MYENVDFAFYYINFNCPTQENTTPIIYLQFYGSYYYSRKQSRHDETQHKWTTVDLELYVTERAQRKNENEEILFKRKHELTILHDADIQLRVHPTNAQGNHK